MYDEVLLQTNLDIMDSFLDCKSNVTKHLQEVLLATVNNNRIKSFEVFTEQVWGRIFLLCGLLKGDGYEKSTITLTTPLRGDTYCINIYISKSPMNCTEHKIKVDTTLHTKEAKEPTTLLSMTVGTLETDTSFNILNTIFKTVYDSYNARINNEYNSISEFV